jgi:hypothetical protein
MIGLRNGAEDQIWRLYWGVQMGGIGLKLVRCFWGKLLRVGILLQNIRVIVSMLRVSIVEKRIQSRIIIFDFL